MIDVKSLKPDVINKEFYESAKAFVVSATKLLISYLQHGEQIPHMIVEKNTIEKEGSCKTEYVPQLLYFDFVDRHRKDVEKLPEYEALIELMQADQTISKHLDCLIGTWNFRIRRMPWDYLSFLLIQQLSRLQKKIEFDLENFNKLYHDLERFYYSESIPVRAFSPIYNFNSDVGEIDLGNGLVVRRIATNELEKLMDASRWNPLLPSFQVLFFRFAMELSYQTKKIIGEPSASAEKPTDIDASLKFDKLITAFRLFKPGILGFNIITTESTLEIPTIFGGMRGHTFHKQFLGQLYNLTKTEVNEFKNFWNAFDKIDLKELTFLSVAIRRFNYAYERDKLEDKLVDFMVAFEALFFKEGESGEFRHKLSIRVSRFLEDEYIQRKRIAEKVNSFYDERSKVVHGEKVELKDDFVRTVEDLLRKSIRLFLERLQTSTHDEILLHLDLD
jgi:hypothetical protein